MMKEEEIDKLIHMNSRLLLLLGYSLSFVTKTEHKSHEDESKYQWLLKAVENIVYLDKPFPPMP